MIQINYFFTINKLVMSDEINNTEKLIRVTLRSGFAYTIFDGKDNSQNDVKRFDLNAPTSIKGGKPTTYCLIHYGANYLKCDHRDVAKVGPKEDEVHTKAAFAQSWEIIYFPHLKSCQLRNGDGTFLGLNDDDRVCDVPGAPDLENMWALEENTPPTTPAKYRIKVAGTGDKYLKINPGTNELDIVFTSGEATIWDFEISSTVPPGRHF